MRIIFFVLMLIGAVSCSKNELATLGKLPQEDEDLEYIRDKAMRNLLVLKGPSTKATDISIESAVAVDSCVSGVHPLYMVNFSNDEGGVLISSDPRDGFNIYLISDSQNIDACGFSDSSSPLSLLYEFIENYREKRLSTITKFQDYEVVETIVSDVSYGPLLHTHWGQRAPFNSYLAYADPTHSDWVMGCCPVAVAQVMRYFNYPLSFGGHNFPWAEINSIYSEYDAIHNPSKALYVSELIYAAGQATNVRYELVEGDAVGNCSESDLARGLNSIGYLYDHENFSTPSVVSSILYNRPVIMIGESSSGNGHAWVVDGYRETVCETRTYDENGNIVHNTPLEDNELDVTTKYLHVNFGWSYLGDGYKRFSRTIDRLNGEMHTYVDSNIFYCNYYDSDNVVHQLVYNIGLKCFTQLRPNIY